ncbi:Ig-like domain-containing protein, partial [Erythrobacter ani]
MLLGSRAEAGNEFIFIDTSVDSYQELVETWDGRGTIVLIDGSADGVEQVLAALVGETNIGAIHIVSHGEEGLFWLGDTLVDSDALTGELAEAFAAIGSKLASDGDILIYGCEVGKGGAGQELLDNLAAITGADIAASIDDTGTILRGGDWTLESRLGVVEAEALTADNWYGLLMPTTISAPDDSLTVRDENGNVLAQGSAGFTAFGRFSPTVPQGGTATWDNVGALSGQSISLRATVVSLSAGDSIRFERPGVVSDDPTFAVFAGGPTNQNAQIEILWEVFFTDTGAPAQIDIDFTVADLDGSGNVPRSREFVVVDTDTLSSFQAANGSNVLFDTSVPGEITASGTQNEGGGVPSAARFSWLETNSWTITYNLVPTAASNAVFSHDGDADLNLGGGGVTVSIPRLDLDDDDSTIGGSGYLGSFVENGGAVSIVDSDVEVTNPNGTVRGATIVLTNAQAGDELLVNGSTAASGSLSGALNYTRTATEVVITGSGNAAAYEAALQAITFQSLGERPSEIDRTIEIGFENASLSSNIAVSTIQVIEVNDPPTAVNETQQSTNEDTPITNIDVLGNDFDGDGDSLTVISASANDGTVTINPDGSLNFTPDPNFNGNDAISYTISDGRGGTSSAIVPIVVNAVNDQPTTVGSLPSQSNQDAQAGIFVDVSGGFTDVEDANLTFAASNLPAGLSIDPSTGFITGTIDNSASQGGAGGLYTVAITATDSGGLSATQDFTWTVTNPPPEANNDGGAGVEDTPITVNVIGNDFDPDGDTINVISASAINGTVVINSDNTLTYTPNLNFNGSDVITYTISDGEGGTDTAVFSIFVNAQNDPPAAVGSLPPQANQDADSGVSVATAGGFDDIDGPSATYNAIGLPPGLSINSATGEISGTIDSSASQGGSGGVYSVTVTLNDGAGGMASQSFSWTVTNPPPVAVNDTVNTIEDTPVNIDVLANDTDPDGDTISVIAASAASGTVVIEADGTLTYTPNNNFNGTDTINYQISDGEGGTSTAQVTVTVTPDNDPPTTVGTLPAQNSEDAAAGISVATAGGFADVDDAGLSYSATGLPPGLSINPSTGEITGTIDNSASEGGAGGVYDVVVTAADAGGLMAIQGFTWTVTNPAPIAANDTVGTNEDVAVNIDVLANDADPDGDTISVIAASAASGTVVIEADGTLTYTPDPDFNGTDTITYTISDGEGGTSMATVAVTVDPVNDDPVPTPIPSENVLDGEAVSVSVAGSFSDPENDPLSFVATGLPPGLSIDPASGLISGTITSDASQSGTGGVYTATITVSDGNGGTATETITFSVTNPPPVAANDTATTDEDVAVNID